MVIAVLNYQKVTKTVTSLQIISSNTPHKQNTKPVKHGVQKQSVYHLPVVSTHLRRRRIAASHLG
jgi:hypothetical protein